MDNKTKFCTKKKICIIRSNPVDPDSRVEKEAQALKEAGYYVHILCWDRRSNHKPRKEYILNGEISITRMGFKAGYAQGSKCIRARIQFQFSMAFWIIKYGRRFDAIHACDIDTALFSYFPARVTGCRFVFDIFDFICGEPRNFKERVVKYLEIRRINEADVTIICTEQRKLQIEGSSPKNLVVIHNSPDKSLIGKKEAIKVDKNKISVVYVGVLLENRLLKEIVNYFSNHPEMDFYVGGFGILEGYIQKFSKKYNNIHFVGCIPYADTLELEKQCDIMIAVYDPSIENHRMAAPNKFYESLMLGKPIIMARGMGMADIVEDNDIGVLIDYSENGFAKGIIEIVDRKAEWDDMSKRMKKIYLERFSWQIMKKRLVSMYKELL